MFHTKVSAHGKFIDKFGIYFSHLTMVAEEPGVKSAGKQKIKGYILRWWDSKMLLGSAFFHNLLKTSCHFMQGIKRIKYVGCVLQIPSLTIGACARVTVVVMCVSVPVTVLPATYLVCKSQVRCYKVPYGV
jgi:hypothetical protein